MENLYPLVGVCIHTKKSFLIDVIDFGNETVMNIIAQNGNAVSYDFKDIYIMEEKNTSIVDFLMNSAVNYDNYELINGEENIYDNEYHEISDEERKEEIRLEEERKKKIRVHNIKINSKIDKLKSHLR